MAKRHSIERPVFYVVFNVDRADVIDMDDMQMRIVDALNAAPDLPEFAVAFEPSEGDVHIDGSRRKRRGH